MPASCPVYCIRATCHVPQRTMDNHPRIVPRGGGSRRTRIYGIMLETNTPRTPVNELQEDRQGHEGLAHRHEGAPQSILSTARGRAVFFSPFVLRLNRNADPTTRRERQAGPSHHRTAATKEPTDQARSGTSTSTSSAKARNGSGESIPRSGWEPYNAMPYGGDPGSSVDPCAGAEAGSPDARRKMQDARRLGTWVAFKCICRQLERCAVSRRPEPRWFPGALRNGATRAFGCMEVGDGATVKRNRRNCRALRMRSAVRTPCSFCEGLQRGVRIRVRVRLKVYVCASEQQASRMYTSHQTAKPSMSASMRCADRFYGRTHDLILPG